MSHTTALYDEHGQEIGYLIHNSDWSGETLVRWPQGEVALPGAVMQAVLRLASGEIYHLFEGGEHHGIPRNGDGDSKQEAKSPHGDHHLEVGQ